MGARRALGITVASLGARADFVGSTAAFKVRELRRAPGSLRRAGLQALPLRVLLGGGAEHRCPSRLLLARGLLASVHMSFP